VVNVKEVTDKLANPDRKSNFKVNITDVKGSDITYKMYLDHQKDYGDGIDYSNMCISDISVVLRDFEVNGPAVSSDIVALSFREKTGFEVDDFSGHFYVDFGKLGFENIKVAYDEKSKAEKDTVIRQNPVKGSKIKSDYNIVLVCSKGEKDKKEATIFVDLPADVTDEVKVTVLVDGVVNSEYSKNVIPAYNSTYTIKIKGKDSVTVLVLLDDEEYREYSVNYEEGYVTTVNSYPYENNETETTAPTEQVTEAPTTVE
jgi:hypothetical protein